MKRKYIIVFISFFTLCILFIWACIVKDRHQNDSENLVNNSVKEIKNYTEMIELTFTFADGDLVAREEIDRIVNRYNEIHPDVVITILSGDGGTYSESLRKKYYSNEFPDIMELKDVTEYVRAGVIEPLPEDIISLFKSVIEIDDKVYNAPISEQVTRGLIYNKKYFRENGLEAPKTYEDFYTLCEEIKTKGDMSPLVVAGKDLWALGFWFTKVYNDQVIAKDPEFIVNCYKGTKNFYDISFQTVFKEMQRILSYAQKDWEMTLDSQVVSYLVDNKAAMLYSGNHMFEQIKRADPDYEIGWVSLASPDGKTRMIGGASTNGFAISKAAASNPEKKEAAEDFIRFFFSEENYKNYCEVMCLTPSTTNDMGIENIGLYQEVSDSINSADYILNSWDEEVDEKQLPPGFRNAVLEYILDIASKDKDITSSCEELNQIWQKKILNFNPVLEEMAEN